MERGGWDKGNGKGELERVSWMEEIGEWESCGIWRVRVVEERPLDWREGGIGEGRGRERERK